MIFEKVGNISNKEDFLEKILVYIRLVEVIAERDKLIIPVIESPSDDIFSEMVDMGVIDSREDVKQLKRIEVFMEINWTN